MNFFVIKDRIDLVLYNIFNIISDCVFMFRFEIKKLVRCNNKFMNIHSGQRCFILGTGPSLNDLTKEQVDKLKNEVVFATNSIYKASVVESIIPSYYTLVDNLCWENNTNIYENIMKKYDKQDIMFITSCKAKKIIDKTGIRKNTIFLYSKKYPTSHINCCIHKNSYITQNVVSSTIRTAMYMGFKEIYLLGCDYTSFLVKSNHCYDDIEEVEQAETFFKSRYNISSNLAMYLEAYARTTRFHYFLSKYAKEHKIKIINITPKSLLDAYPREDVSIIL